MPVTPEDPAFLSVLPPAFGETPLPVTYRMLRGEGPNDESVLRSAASEPYRAAKFACHPFHRPMTKPLRAP